MRKSEATIQDIADYANVSKSTVSRVLNNTSAVNKDKRNAVLRAVDELGFSPNIPRADPGRWPVDDDRRGDPKHWQPLL